MKIEQIYTKCLSQGTYYIESNGEAAIIDPLRETQPYLDRLEKGNVQLKYIFETHFHADFVSGHLDLSQITLAPIIFGPMAEPNFNAIIAKDNQIFEIGNIKIKVIHTPGHTLESVCYLAIDENGVETALFSGDTLFLGDVGRPDLAQKGENITQEYLAGLLYDSLYNKILPLSDDIMVYPAHGSGSACGKNMMKKTLDTLGNQKKVNYALNQSSKENFIEAVLEGLTSPPAYFGMNVHLNKKGYNNFEINKSKSLNPLSTEELELISLDQNVMILDTRSSEEFSQGFIPKSIHIGLDGEFAPWVGEIIENVSQKIVLISDNGREEEAITRLARIGFDNVIGYLQYGFQAWVESGRKIETIQKITAEEFERLLDVDKKIILDVRRESEFRSGHLENAINKPLEAIHEWLKELSMDKPFFLHCAGGYRSSIAASILYSHGFTNFHELEGGLSAISKTKVTIIERSCRA